MRRVLTPLVAGLAVVGFAACSPDEGDFASEAEDFISDEEGDVATQVGQVFTDVECEEPADTDTGTTFTCTATGADGLAYTFTNQIVGENEFQVMTVTPTDSATTPGSSTPATTPTT